MKSAIAPLEGNKVKLSIEVDEAEFERDVDAAFRKIAREVRLPGFRPGKAPRRILEARIGLESARQQALQDGIPQYLAKAVREHDVDLIATPKVEITGGESEGAVAFDAECEVRPVIVVPGYGGLRIELPAVEATDEDIANAVDAERRRHGALDDAGRAIESGDYVTLDLTALREGEPVAGLNTEDFLYEVGKGWVTDDFDDRLAVRTSAMSWPSPAPRRAPITRPTSRSRSPRYRPSPSPKSPTNGSATTSASSRRSMRGTHSIRERLNMGKANQARNLMLDRTSSALAELVDEEPPDALVQAELQSQIQNFVRQLQSQGIDVNQWLAATGQDPATFTERLREQSGRAVKVDLALRAIATAESLEVGDDDIEAEYTRIAMRANQKVNQVRKAYEKNDAVADLASEIRKSKALEWLLHRIEIVDPEGKPISNDLLLGHSEHDHDHSDHDHGDDADHDGDADASADPTDDAES